MIQLYLDRMPVSVANTKIKFQFGETNQMVLTANIWTQHSCSLHKQLLSNITFHSTIKTTCSLIWSLSGGAWRISAFTCFCGRIMMMSHVLLASVCLSHFLNDWTEPFSSWKWHHANNMLENEFEVRFDAFNTHRRVTQTNKQKSRFIKTKSEWWLCAFAYLAGCSSGGRAGHQVQQRYWRPSCSCAPAFPRLCRRKYWRLLQEDTTP